MFLQTQNLPLLPNFRLNSFVRVLGRAYGITLISAAVLVMVLPAKSLADATAISPLNSQTMPQSTAKAVATQAPIVAYQSIFSEYHAYQDPYVGDWKEANQTVQQIGGWRAYMREAMQAMQEKPAMSDHSHHLMDDAAEQSMQGGNQ